RSSRKIECRGKRRPAGVLMAATRISVFATRKLTAPVRRRLPRLLKNHKGHKEHKGIKEFFFVPFVVRWSGGSPDGDRARHGMATPLLTASVRRRPPRLLRATWKIRAEFP